MCTLWENYSGSDLEPRKYKSRISDSILQRMSAGWYPGLWSERGMLPAFGRQHRWGQQWPESMYLLDKKIYLKFHQIEKILSGQTRRVPNPGFWQNKVQFSRQSIRHTTPELQDTFWVDHHFTMQIQSHNARFSGGSRF